MDQVSRPTASLKRCIIYCVENRRAVGNEAKEKDISKDYLETLISLVCKASNGNVLKEAITLKDVSAVIKVAGKRNVEKITSQDGCSVPVFDII